MLRRLQLFYLIWLPDLLWKGSTFEVRKFLTPWIPFNTKKYQENPPNNSNKQFPNIMANPERGKLFWTDLDGMNFSQKGFLVIFVCGWGMKVVLCFLYWSHVLASSYRCLIEIWGRSSGVPVPFKVCLHTWKVSFFWLKWKNLSCCF